MKRSKFIGLAGCAFGVALMGAALFGDAPTTPPIEQAEVPAPVAPPPAQPIPRAASDEGEVSTRAVRLVYDEQGRAWGSGCALDGGGWVSVKHVTDNGKSALGPPDAVVLDNGPSDWSFIGVDPLTLDADDYPEIVKGDPLYIHGFVARDRRGQIVPGVAYIDDPVQPYWWVELRDAVTDQFGRSLPAEGVLGGFSGSCVLDEDKRVVAVVHANGFSKIEDTTNTFAQVVPVRMAILEAQGKVSFTAPTSLIRSPLIPRIETGRWGMSLQ